MGEITLKSFTTKFKHNHSKNVPINVFTERKRNFKRGRLWVDRLTHNESHLTLGVFVTAGHHGSHCVINHCHKVQVKFLKAGTAVIILKYIELLRLAVDLTLLLYSYSIG